MPKKKASSGIGPPCPSSLSGLRPDPSNPRDIPDERREGLAYSLEEFGDVSGIVWNTRTEQLVCGHQRVSALQTRHGDLAVQDGFVTTPSGDRFPVRVVDWPMAKQRAANVAANNRAISGEFTGDLDAYLDSVRLELPNVFSSVQLDKVLLFEPDKGLLEEIRQSTSSLKDQVDKPAKGTGIPKRRMAMVTVFMTVDDAERLEDCVLTTMVRQGIGRSEAVLHIFREGCRG